VSLLVAGAVLAAVPTTAQAGSSTTSVGRSQAIIVLPTCYDPTWKWKGSSCGGQ
jgi:hypothetical protein